MSDNKELSEYVKNLKIRFASFVKIGVSTVGSYTDADAEEIDRIDAFEVFLSISDKMNKESTELAKQSENTLNNNLSALIFQHSWRDWALFNT